MEEEDEAENWNARRMRKQVSSEKKMMTVEDYCDFFESRNIHFATIPSLNQIIHMHGFRNLHRSKKKKTIGDTVVNGLDLIDLSRSTLKQSNLVSSSTPTLTLEELIVDIEALKWQECALTSLQIFNSESETQTIAEPKQNNKSKKRKRVSMKKLMKSNKGNSSDDDGSDS